MEINIIIKGNSSNPQNDTITVSYNIIKLHSPMIKSNPIQKQRDYIKRKEVQTKLNIYLTLKLTINNIIERKFSNYNTTEIQQL